MTRVGGHPGLLGQTVVVAGAGAGMLEIIRAVVGERGLVAVVSSDHDVVTAAVGLAEAAGAPILGLTSDPVDAAVWRRNAPHIEQRLGPIDAVIAVGPPGLGKAMAPALAHDLAARQHGVFVAVTDVADATTQSTAAGFQGVRVEAVRPTGLAPESLAAAVLQCVTGTTAQDG